MKVLKFLGIQPIYINFRVLVDLNEEGKALSELSGSCLTLTKDGEYSRDVSDFIYEFQDSTSFALILAAEIHQTNRQYDRAADCYKKALAHNPFLFTPFQKLCQIGKGQEPEQLFHIAQECFHFFRSVLGPVPHCLARDQPVLVRGSLTAAIKIPKCPSVENPKSTQHLK